MRRSVFACCLLLSSLAGCGYTTGSLLPGNIRTISIDPFENKVAFVSENVRGLYVPLLETKVRGAIINRFQFDGHLKLSKTGKSDLLLKGALTSFDRDELRLTDNQDVSEYRIRITVSMTLLDPASGVEIWTEPSFSGEATYFTTGARAKSESAALEEALTDLSRRVVERTIENW